MLSKATMLSSMLHRLRGTALLKEMDLWTLMHMLGLSKKRLQHSMTALSTPLCMLSSFTRPIMKKSKMIHLRTTKNPLDLSLCMLLLDECTRTAAQHYPRQLAIPCTGRPNCMASSFRWGQESNYVYVQAWGLACYSASCSKVCSHPQAPHKRFRNGPSHPWWWPRARGSLIWWWGCRRRWIWPYSPHQPILSLCWTGRHSSCPFTATNNQEGQAQDKTQWFASCDTSWDHLQCFIKPTFHTTFLFLDWSKWKDCSRQCSHHG